MMTIHFTLFAKASETKTERQMNGKIVREKDRVIKRQKYKKGEKDRIIKKKIQNLSVLLFGVESYTICVQIFFERKYTVYKFESTRGWIHMSCIKIDLSILNNI